MSDATTDELSAYLEGDLDDASRDRIEAALATDESLAAELEDLRALVGDLNGLPEMEAPAGLLASVMAEVADLAIPVADEGLAAAAGPVVQVAANDTDDRDNVVRVAWWIKGPAASAVAALLVIGFGVWMFGQRQPAGPPSATAMRPGFAPEAADAPVAAPSMTGSAEGSDALVAADDAEEIRERLRAIAMADSADADPELMGDATPEVARGMLDPRVAARRSAPKPAAKPAAPARAASEPPAEGVFVAEFEREDEGVEVAAVEELDADAGDRSLSLEEVSFGASRTAARGGAATLALNSDDRAVLVSALRAKGWSVAPAGSGFQVTVTEGEEEALVTLLRQHGSLSIESPMRSMRDGKARLVVTFR
jgi:anti-sigma factor RsiW